MLRKPALIESDYYVTPDGEEFLLTGPGTRVVYSWEGEGLPPIDYITQRGPFQHGETPLNYFLRPRILQAIIRHSYCDREAYWTGRNNLLSYLRPNRQLTTTLTPGKIRKRLANGERRDIDVFILEGPGFAARTNGRWDETAYTETLRFIAHNPVWYDPVQRSSSFSSPVSELVFPITFPITFGAFEVSGTITYVGTWNEYPVITVNGPISNFTIRNVTTDEDINISASISAGQSIIIDLRYGVKTITRNDGTNLIGTLSSDSDLASWHLAPDPEAAGGVNDILISGGSADSNTSILVDYYRRYIGI